MKTLPEATSPYVIARGKAPKQSGFRRLELLIGIVLFGMLSIGHCKTTST